MKERHIRVVMIFAVLSGVLLNYQNCGSQKGSSGANASAVVSSDGHMDMIDANSTGGISFVQAKATLGASDADLHASGICAPEQNGSLLSWQVTDSDNNEVAHGKSLCDQGVFDVVFEGAAQVACDAQLNLLASLGAKAKTELVIDKKCD